MSKDAVKRGEEKVKSGVPLKFGDPDIIAYAAEGQKTAAQLRAAENCKKCWGSGTILASEECEYCDGEGKTFVSQACRCQDAV